MSASAVLRRLARGAMAAASLAMIIATAITVGALAAGYRPVVLQTGSMGEYAPAGSLVIAAPRAGTAIDVGDVVVMRRPGLANVTHRVIEIEQEGEVRFAITKGDANEAPDATPYPLDGEQLVSRWALADWGWRLQSVTGRSAVVPFMGLALVVVTVSLLRRIWGDPVDPDPQPATERPAVSPGRRMAKPAIALTVPVAAVLSGGVAWALFSSSDDVGANTFTTPDCFDAQLGTVQTGETVHAIDGVVNVAITAVDPARSFLLLSVTSSANEPADAAVMGRLAVGGTVLELARNTDAGTPPAVIVDWTIVEFACGVSVSRGTVAGDGTNVLDVTVPAVDPATSFVLASSAAEAGATSFDGDDLFVAELTSATNLRIRSQGPTPFSPQRTFAWQVVSFADPGDITVQTAGTTLAAGVTSGTIALPQAADPSTTFLLTGVTSASSGPDIGERMVRTHLTSPTTVEVGRLVGGDPVEVRVQVVTLRDGTTVRHGTVDLAPGTPVREIGIDAVDPDRSSVISTVQVPGTLSGGSTDAVGDDVVGEASAAFSLTDPTTVRVSRGATTSAASFGWQVIEWAGPTWWDPGYLYRQRIDVTTSTAAPDAYTVPVEIDHAALVSLGLSAVDGADARVVRWDGAGWTELDRVLDDGSAWNTTTTTLWFRTRAPIPAASTASYWLYFGNEAPGPPAADPDEVYALHEGFESGTLGDFEDRTGGTAWYDASPWSRRIRLTVPAAQVVADLTGFPLLVSLTEPDLAASARADGADIRFTAADGATPLPHEIERWDPATGSLVAWVGAPTLSGSTDTVIHLYYGAADAPGQDDVRATWPAAVEAAWHLGRDPTGAGPQVDDSTANNNDGLGAGAMTTTDLGPGRVGSALDLDGVDDRLEVTPFDVGGASGLTLSGWVSLDAHTPSATVITKGAGGTTPLFELSIDATGALEAKLELDGATTAVTSPAGAVGLASWHHLAATWDGGALRIHVDGVEVGTQPAGGSLSTDPPLPVALGGRVDGSGHLDGRLDEVRVERVARDQAWLAAVVANQATPTSFVVPGPVEVGTWFDQGDWSYRKPLTVRASAVAGPVSPHVLLVDIVDAELRAKGRSDARDVVFTAADGVTRLDHVVEGYDGGTGALTAWVAVPMLAPTGDHRLFMYYGNADADDQQWPAAVFGPDADLTILFG